MMAPSLPLLGSSPSPRPEGVASSRSRRDNSSGELSRGGDETFRETPLRPSNPGASFEFGDVLHPTRDVRGDPTVAGAALGPEIRGVRDRHHDDDATEFRSEISEPNDNPPNDPGFRQAAEPHPTVRAGSEDAFLKAGELHFGQAWDRRAGGEENNLESTGRDGRGNETSSIFSDDEENETETKPKALPSALLETRFDRDPRRVTRNKPRQQSVLFRRAFPTDETTNDDHSWSRVTTQWSLRGANDDSFPETDFVPGAKSGNARRSVDAAELMTPSLGEGSGIGGEEDSGGTAEEEDDAGGETRVSPSSESDRVSRRSGSSISGRNRDRGDSLQRYLTTNEITTYYAKLALDSYKKAGKPLLCCHRSSTRTWNGDRPGLCRLAGAPSGNGAAIDSSNEQVNRVSQGECFLSRAYTEGFRAPIAFAAYPSRDVLCEKCGDVAWDPVRWPERLSVVKDELVLSNDLWCRGCLLVKGVVPESVVDDLPTDETVVMKVSLKRVLCRHALRCEKVAIGGRFGGDGDDGNDGDLQKNASRVELDGDDNDETKRSLSGKSSLASPQKIVHELRWEMDRTGHGCPDSGRLCDRQQTERDCASAIVVCGLPFAFDPGDTCLKRLRAGEAAIHKNEECEFRLVPCSRREFGCEQQIRAKHAGAHFRLCELRPFVCPNRPKCSWRGVRRTVEGHLAKDCAWEIVPCGFVDDDPDGQKGKQQRARDSSIGNDGRVYTFGGDVVETEVRTRKNSLRSQSKRQWLGLLRVTPGAGSHDQNAPGSVSGSEKVSSYGQTVSKGSISQNSDSAFYSASTSSKFKRGFIANERSERGERCGVRLPKCKLASHRAVCRFQRALCRHCKGTAGRAFPNPGTGRLPIVRPSLRSYYIHHNHDCLLIHGTWCLSRLTLFLFTIKAPRALRRVGQHEAECVFRFFDCARCGKTIPHDQKKAHMLHVCPEQDVRCAFAKYGCLCPVVPRRAHGAHQGLFLPEHLRLLMTCDRNAPGPTKTSEGDPYPDLLSSFSFEVGSQGKESDPTGKECDEKTRRKKVTKQSDSTENKTATKETFDGFRVLVSRHELTFSDLRTIKATAVDTTEGVVCETETLLSSVADANATRRDATEFLLSEMQKAREGFSAQCKDAVGTCIAFEESVEAKTSAVLIQSAAAQSEVRTSISQIQAHCFISQLVTVCPYIAQHGTDTFRVTIAGETNFARRRRAGRDGTRSDERNIETANLYYRLFRAGFNQNAGEVFGTHRACFELGKRNRGATGARNNRDARAMREPGVGRCRPRRGALGENQRRARALRRFADSVGG
jgi:hypothetical protein